MLFSHLLGDRLNLPANDHSCHTSELVEHSGPVISFRSSQWKALFPLGLAFCNKTCSTFYFSEVLRRFRGTICSGSFKFTFFFKAFLIIKVLQE